MELHSTILGQGRPLLILHGFLGMSDNWKTLGRKFSEEGMEVHLIDQRNHGRSPHSSEFNYQLLAQDVKDYMDIHSLTSAFILGHSMGGKTAMMAASQYPDLVEKLVVVDIAPRFYPPHHEQILKGLKALDQAQLNSRGEAEELLSSYIKDQGIKLFLLKNLYWKSKDVLGLRLNLDALIANIDAIGEALPETAIYNKPSLFIRGANSSYITREDEMEIVRQFPEAEIVTIPKAGHWVHAENKQAFFEAVMQFL